MAKRAIRALVPTGFGINCEAETAHALRLAGAEVDLPHLGELLREPAPLARAQILVLAGGFSFGDHLGAGRALANRLRNVAGDLDRFIDDGGLLLGVCNGFQTMVRLGLVPSGRVGDQTVTLAPNSRGTFYDGWVRLSVDPASPCVFTRGLDRIELPVRHGEGRLLALPPTLERLERDRLVPLRYACPESGQPAESFPANPNGSQLSAAAICSESGRIFGLMPHPEAYLYQENAPEWRRRRPPVDRELGLALFLNAVEAARRG